MEKTPKPKIDKEILASLDMLTSKEVEYTPEAFPDLVRQFSFLKEHFKLDGSLVIYHPCGSYDVSLSEVFPESRVIYVDLEEQPMAALSAQGFESVVADATQYNPGEVDLVVLLNPQIESKIPVFHLKVGGYVFANDYHGNAGELLTNPDYECLGFVVDENDNIKILPVNQENHREGAHSNTFFVFKKNS